MLTRWAPAGALFVLALAGCGVVDDLVGSKELSVRRFVADPPEVGAGAAVTLSWDVSGADSIEIDNGVGAVLERGNREVRPTTSIRYVLVARKGSEQVTALVNVTVLPTGRPSPAPTPGPSPSPVPSPSPSPKASPTPSPSPTPGTETPRTVRCTPSVAFAKGCGVSLSYLQPLGETRCISLPEADLGVSCPAAFGVTRDVKLLLEARGFAGRGLAWRRAASSPNYVLNPGGALSGEGRTTVELRDVLLGDRTELELLDGAQPVARVTVSSN